MLVDNSIQPQLFSQDIPDFSDIFHTELFGLQQQPSSASPSSANLSESSANSPESDSHLLTPPQPIPPSSFPTIASDNPLSSDLFDFGIDDDMKVLSDSLSYPPPANVPYPSFDFLSFSGGFGASGAESSSSASKGIDICIDPILVDSPADTSSVNDEDEMARETDAADAAPTEHVTQPVKVAGHGNKGRKGTVQSGSVTKKAPIKEKENAGGKAKAKKEVDDDELPADWRPPPEVYAKMSSKEKRQLRNKISARNFRVRRKEYITALEGDIAERDQMLSAIRSELGSSRSENLALRQEIAALKKALLGGRGSNASPSDPLAASDIEGVLNLPPPAPLPAISAAEALANSASAATSSSPPTPFTPNTQKDLPASGSSGRSFWGGAQVGLGGGYTPVHTAIINTPTWPLKNNVLQENLNPALNGPVGKNQKTIGKESMMQQRGFDGFADMNPFTMKNLDAYRMQLWGKMAAQQQQQQSLLQQQNKLTGLVGNMRPSYFASSTKHNISSATLAGKSAVASTSSKSTKDSETALVAAMASQTFVSRIGNAFWDAFSGSGSSNTSRTMDADKVRKVLEGKAVVRVVDVDSPSPSMPPPPKLVSRATSPVIKQHETASSSSASPCTLTDLLEESMRSLSLGKKH